MNMEYRMMKNKDGEAFFIGTFLRWRNGNVEQMNNPPTLKLRRTRGMSNFEVFR